MLILIAAAHAGPPTLLHEQDPVRARRRVWRDLRVFDVELRTPGSLLRQQTPYLVRAALSEPCQGPPSDNATILRQLDEAEELRLSLRAAEAWERLDAARGSWACIAEPADAVVGARMHFLVGIAEHARGNPEGAAQAFRAALRSDPELAWDDDFAPDARPAFDAAKAEVRPTVSVTVVPAGAELALRVDGRSLVPRDGVFELRAGPHLLQLSDGPTFWAELQQDDWLVVPGQMPPQLLTGIDQPEERARVEGLLVDAGANEPVLVAGRTSTWAWSGEWRQHRPPLGRRVGRPLVVAGGALLTGGLVWMAVEGAEARQRHDAASEAFDTAAYQVLQAEQQAGLTRYKLATGLSALGGLTVLGGGVMVVATW